MPIDLLVVNASPLITLFRSGLAEILPALCPGIVVPNAVWQEITEAGYEDAAAKGLDSVNWLQHLPSEPIDPVVQAWDLGAGESAVLSHAYAHEEYRAVLDDAAARCCARALNIRTLGTGGLLVVAKRAGVILSVADALNELKKVWIVDFAEDRAPAAA